MAEQNGAPGVLFDGGVTPVSFRAVTKKWTSHSDN